MSWEAPVFELRRVRNANEARLFVEFLGGVVLDSRAAGDEFQLLAETPRGRNVFPFRLAHGLTSSDPTDLGPGTSEVLDPAMLVSHAERVEADGPDGLEPREYARRLRLAAAGLRQAALALGFRSEWREGLFLTDASAAFARRSPERFRAARLLSESARLRSLADEVTAALDVGTVDAEPASPSSAGGPSPDARWTQLSAELDDLARGGPELQQLIDRAYSRFSDDPAEQLAALEALRASGMDADTVRERVAALGLSEPGLTHRSLAQIEIARRRLQRDDLRGAFEALGGVSPDAAVRDRLMRALLAHRHDLPGGLDEVVLDSPDGNRDPRVEELLRRFDGDPAAKAALADDLAVWQRLRRWVPEPPVVGADPGTTEQRESLLRAYVAATNNVRNNREARLRKVLPPDQVLATLSMTPGGRPSDQVRIGGSVSDAVVIEGLTAAQTIEVLGLDHLDTGRTPYLEQRPDGTLRPARALFFLETPVTQEMRDGFRVPVPPALWAEAKDAASISESARTFLERARPQRAKADPHGLAGLRPLAIDPSGHLDEPCAIAPGATLRHRSDDGDFTVATYGLDPRTGRSTWSPNTRMTQSQLELVAAHLPRAHRDAVAAALAERTEQ